MKNNLRSEKILSIFFTQKTWQFLWEERYKIDLLPLVESLLPTFLEKLDSLKDVVDLTEKSFTMADFRKICKARNISISKEPRTTKESKTKQGEYSIDSKTLKEHIWIKYDLPRKLRLFVAAHELSHKILHKESMLKPCDEFRPASDLIGKYVTDTHMRLLIAELEADLLACLMVMRKK